MKNLKRLLAVAFAFSSALCAQTIQQAQALHRAGKLWDANEMFKSLEPRYPNDPAFKVAWGRVFLDNAQPEEAAGLFDEAMKIKADYAIYEERKKAGTLNPLTKKYGS